MTTDLTRAWQLALAAEQQAAFGYSVLGPRLTGTDVDLARTCQTDHEAVRDTTAQRIAATGATPVAPQGDYPAVYPLADSPRTLAARLEDGCAAAWRFAYLAAATGPGPSPARTTAQQNLTASALRATRWRMLAQNAAPVTAFPGI